MPALIVGAALASTGLELAWWVWVLAGLDAIGGGVRQLWQ